MIPIIINITSWTYLLLIIIFYFSKKRINNMENRIYHLMLLTMFCGVALDFTSGIFFLTENALRNSFLHNLIIKGLFSSYMVWDLLLIFYVYTITIKKIDEKREKRIRTIFKIIVVLVLILFFALPIEINLDTFEPTGTSIYILTITTIFLIIYLPVMLIINIKTILNKKYLPLLLYLILGIVTIIIQNQTGIYLMSFIDCFITILMYFTIENPDMRLIEQLNIAKTQAERANTAKTDFLSSMSHEIRTPLNAIVGFSNSLVENPNIPEDAKGDINDILAASDNLLEIVNGVLDISKIEANKIEIINKEYDTKKLFNELSNLTKVRIGEKPIEFITKIDETIPRVLYGDSTRVKQVIVNLLTNAAKYTDEGKIIFNTQSVIKDDICRLIVSVEDTGRGIKKEAIEKLFTKFERLEEDKNTTIEGTGLGLAITKKLIELMNGRIVVYSDYGKGSKFTVSIDQRIVKNPTINLEEVVAKVEVFDLSNYKVLVVDDNKLNIKVASRLLLPYKINVESVTSGFEAIEKLKNGSKYDLILMDDMMPKLSGTETLIEIKKLNLFSGPIIALTANALTGMKEKYLEAGFNDYLSKPIEKEELSRVLKQYFNKNDEKTNSYDIINNESSELKDTKFLEENGVDVSKGIELLGDIDMYNDTMRDFLKEINEKYPKTVEYKNNKDMPNYAILVHSIKSDSKYLGFTKLAELAYAHELKSKENDINYVDENFDTLKQEIARIVSIIKKYLNEG